MYCYRIILTASLVLVSFALAPVARSAISLPGGDLFATGEFEFQYGSSNELSILNAFYFVGEQGASAPVPNVQSTGMDYSYSFQGVGTGLFTVTYRLENTTALTFTDLRFFGLVDPVSDAFEETASDINFGAIGPGEPAAFEVHDFNAPPDLSTRIQSSNVLSNAISCPAGCDAEFALQATIASLSPGQIWEVIAGISDDGQRISERRILSTDTQDEQVTFSMNSTVVPLPAPILLLGSALAVLFGLAPRARTRIHLAG